MANHPPAVTDTPTATAGPGTTAEPSWRIGSGHCPVCGAGISSRQLLCRQHWALVPYHLKVHVRVALAGWETGAVTLAELRAVQAVAVAEVQP